MIAIYLHSHPLLSWLTLQSPKFIANSFTSLQGTTTRTTVNLPNLLIRIRSCCSLYWKWYQKIFKESKCIFCQAEQQQSQDYMSGLCRYSFISSHQHCTCQRIPHSVRQVPQVEAHRQWAHFLWNHTCSISLRLPSFTARMSPVLLSVLHCGFCWHAPASRSRRTHRCCQPRSPVWQCMCKKLKPDHPYPVRHQSTL